MDYDLRLDSEVNLEFFDTEVRPLLTKNNGVPLFRYTFRVYLPFYLPFPEDEVISADHSIHGCVQTLKFKQVEQTKVTQKGGSLHNRLLSERLKVIQVDMSLFSTFDYLEFIDSTFDRFTNNPSSSDLPLEDVDFLSSGYIAAKESGNLLSYILTIQLEFLDKFVMDYKLYYKDYSVAQLNTGNLDDKIAYSILNMKTLEVKKGVLEKVENKDVEVEMLDSSEYKIFSKNRIIKTVHSEKYSRCLHYILDSERYIKEGDIEKSTIFIQTAVEICIKTLFQSLLEENPQVVNPSFKKDYLKGKRLGVKKLLLSGVKPLLDPEGDWEVGSSNPASVWSKYTYTTRNNLAHEGYETSYIQAKRAYEVALMFMLYLISLVRNHKEEYSKTYKELEDLEMWLAVCA